MILLNNVVDIIMGQSPKSSTYNEEREGLPFYQGKAEFGENYPTPVKWCSKPGKIAEKGDVLISVRAPVGPTNICQERSCVGRGLAAVQPLGGMPTQYLRYWLITRHHELEIKSTGTTFKAISGDTLRNLKINLHPLPEQKRIVAKIESLFSRLDSAKDSLERVRAEIKRYRQSVLKAAFEGKFSHHSDDRKKLLSEIEKKYPEKIKEKKKYINVTLDDLYGLPQGWEWSKCFFVCSSVRDGTHDTPAYVPKGFPLITSKNLVDGYIDFENVSFISERDYVEINKRSEVHNGDILFAMIGTIGNPVVVDMKQPFSIKNVGLFKVDKTFLNSKYLCYWLSSSLFNHICQQKKLIKGTTQRFMPLGNLREAPVPFCLLAEQSEIVEAIESRFERVRVLEDTVEQSLERIEQLKQSILKQAFEGRLVESDPSDEPVEFLLERIKKEKLK